MGYHLLPCSFVVKNILQHFLFCRSAEGEYLQLLFSRKILFKRMFVLENSGLTLLFFLSFKSCQYFVFWPVFVFNDTLYILPWMLYGAFLAAFKISSFFLGLYHLTVKLLHRCSVCSSCVCFIELLVSVSFWFFNQFWDVGHCSFKKFLPHILTVLWDSKHTLCEIIWFWHTGLWSFVRFPSICFLFFRLCSFSFVFIFTNPFFSHHPFAARPIQWIISITVLFWNFLFCSEVSYQFTIKNLFSFKFWKST